jgi:hypothetical protein
VGCNSFDDFQQKFSFFSALAAAEIISSPIINMFFIITSFVSAIILIFSRFVNRHKKARTEKQYRLFLKIIPVTSYQLMCNWSFDGTLKRQIVTILYCSVNRHKKPANLVW